MPWGDIVSDELFRHFVLPVRVNNENLDDSRRVFHDQLAPRVEGLPMYDAILEVNHWCHEKANYQPSDARTSSPLATVRTAHGRAARSRRSVAALRSVGIPARQVYTPAGRIPTTTTPGSRPGPTDGGISSGPASRNRCSTWGGSTPRPAAGC